MARKKTPEDAALFTPEERAEMQARATEWDVDGSGKGYRAFVLHEAHLAVQECRGLVSKAENVKEVLALMSEFTKLAGILNLRLDGDGKK